MLMGDQHQRGTGVAALFADQRHDLIAGGGVEVTGGLIRQQQPGAVDQGPGHGHALALAAAELRWQVTGAIREAHALQ